VKKLILLLVVLSLVFIVINRDKLFVRDPLASVARNGVKEDGTQVFINFHNDVLLENDNAPMYVELIEKDHPIGLPKELHCMHWLMCLTDNYPATLLQQNEGATIESMDAKTVKFQDTNNRETTVTLR
jgi:hypothetical protein